MSNPFANLGGLGSMMAGFQQRIQQIQNEAEAAEYEVTAGSGQVTVTINGKYEFIDIEIDEAAAKDVAKLENLILEAANAATDKVRENMRQKLGQVTAGLPIPPGMLGL